LQPPGGFIHCAGALFFSRHSKKRREEKNETRIKDGAQMPLEGKQNSENGRIDV